MSVVLPTYNRDTTLGRSIQSVLAQTYGNLELIVVDDASTDTTREVLQSFSDPRLRWVSNERQSGVSASRNRGVAEAVGEWVAFQDSDDEWRVEKLARQVAAISDDAVLILCGDVVVNDYGMSYLGLATEEAVVDVTPQVILRIPGAPCFMVRRQTMLDVGGFDDALRGAEDWELALRLSDRGRVLMVNEPLVVRQKTPGSLFADEAHGTRGIRVVLDRHAGRFRKHPDAWALYCNLVGQSDCRHGQLAAGRAWFRKALAVRPLAPRTWANLLASFLGARFFKAYVGLARSLRSRFAAPVRPPVYSGGS